MFRFVFQLTALFSIIAGPVSQPLIASEPESADAAITVYFGMPYRNGVAFSYTTENTRITNRVNAAGVDATVKPKPVARALRMYQRKTDACILFPPGEMVPGELESAPVGVYDFWLYTAEDSGFTSRNEVMRVGSLEGSQLYYEPSEFPTLTFMYSASWQGVVELIRKGRVDAVTLGAAALEGVPGAADGLRRLGDTPLKSIPIAVHCHNTPKNAAFIDKLNVSVGGGRDIRGN